MDTATCPLCDKPSSEHPKATGSGFLTCDKYKVRCSPGAAPEDDPTVRNGPPRPALADLLRHCGYRAGGRLLSVGAGPRPFGARGQGWTVEVASGPVARHPVDAPYDVVLMDGYLGRVSDPREAMRAVGRMLRPRGALVVIAPDFSSLAARAMGPLWGPVRDKPRILFSRTGLEDVLRQEGFVLMDIALGASSPLARLLPGPLARLPLPDPRGEMAILSRWAR